MPDNIKVMAGTGDDTVAPPIATDLIAGQHYQRIKAGYGPDGVWTDTADADGARFPIGGAALGALAETAPTTDTASAGLNGRLQRIAQRLSSLIALLPTALGAGGGLKIDGSGTPLQISSGQLPPSLSQQPMATSLPVAIASNQSAVPVSGTVGITGSVVTSNPQIPASLGQKAMPASLAVAIASDQSNVPTQASQVGTWTVQPGNTPNTTRWKVDVRERAIVVVGGTLTRPANATPYVVGDAISNNATAASVTAQSFAVSDTIDAPVVLERMRVHTTDLGLGASVVLQAFLFAADPALASGILGGDNAAFLTRRGAFIGSLTGTFQAFSDGGVAVLVPDQGQRIWTAPVAGATLLYVLYRVNTAFTPSGNSTTLTPTLEGFQALA